MEIIVNNVICKIIKATPIEIAFLESITTGFAANYFFSTLYKKKRWDGKIRFYSRRSKSFPTGLLTRVIKAFIQGRMVIHLTDVRKKPKIQSNSVVLNGIELRPFQKECMNLCTARFNRGVIACAVNSGKTEIAIAIVKKLGIKSLWLTDSISLLSQTYKRFVTRLGNESQLGTIVGGEFNPNFITIGSVDTLWSYCKKAKKDPTSEKSKLFYEFLDSIQLVINDECAKVPAETWYKILCQLKNAYYRYGLSGSPYKGSIEDYYLIGSTGETVYEVTSSQLIRMGISSRPAFEIININLPHHPLLQDETGKKKKTPWPKIREVGIIKNEHRNAIITTKAKTQADLGERVVILFSMLDHGNLLFEDLYGLIGERVAVLTGKHTNDERIEVLENFKPGNIILASNIFDEGVDIAGGIDCLILAGGGKSDQKSVQRVGRALRMNSRGVVKIIDFKDNVNKILCRHSMQRIKSYREEGFI
jgi:superfamily II DNA or RNA helicase